MEVWHLFSAAETFQLSDDWQGVYPGTDSDFKRPTRREVRFEKLQTERRRISLEGVVWQVEITEVFGISHPSV